MKFFAKKDGKDKKLKSGSPIPSALFFCDFFRQHLIVFRGQVF